MHGAGAGSGGTLGAAVSRGRRRKLPTILFFSTDLFANVRAARSQCISPKPGQQSTGKNGESGRFHTTRLASGGGGGESARMSLKGGNSPSTLAVPVRGRDSRLAAKERAAAKERSADQRRAKAEMAAAREGGGADRARHLASKRTKVAASALQRPPISRAMTVSRQRFDLHSSGYVRSLARLAVSKAAPAVRPPALRGRPAAVRGETSVVSTASWAPPHSGRPLAMTSMRRSSWRAGSTFKSLTSTLRATAAPASLHTRAAARSRGPPLARKMPERGQAARWSPQGSRCARQRHLAEVSGRGKRSLRRRMARKSALREAQPAGPAGRRRQRRIPEGRPCGKSRQRLGTPGAANRE